MTEPTSSGVLLVKDVALSSADDLLGRYGLQIVVHHDDESIPGSFWGEPEAGIVGLEVHVRRDTPIHSLLHEACHVICMDEARRSELERDAGGDDLEEAAVCYLQVVLASYLDGVDRHRLMEDMDTWGYSFRLGSARRWWREDADDARSWLLEHGLLTPRGGPMFKLHN